jgi:pimeloyl-ACP methyl ester carboxylesterase
MASETTRFDAYREVSLSQGTIRYRDEGEGPTLVFIHGILVNGALWNAVIPQLSGRFRCVVPDLPLGAHSIPVRRDADLSPRGVAQLVADFLEALDLRDVTLVGNDTGGAICQLTIARHPQRIARLVLTNCDAYEAFFPPLLRPFQWGARLLGVRFADLLVWMFRSRWAQRALMRTVAHHRPDGAELDGYFIPPARNRGVRRDLARFLRAVSNRYTLEAARTFPNFRRPVMIVWGEDDLFFSARNARRLQRAFPDAALEFLPRARAFVPVDQPEALARRIAEFVHASATVGA